MGSENCAIDTEEEFYLDLRKEEVLSCHDSRNLLVVEVFLMESIEPWLIMQKIFYVVLCWWTIHC